MELKLSAALCSALCRPGHPDVPLRRDGDRFIAGEGTDMLVFPIVEGAPVLIDEDRSLFRHADYTDGGVTTMDIRAPSERLNTPIKRLKALAARLVPTKSRSISDFPARAALVGLLREKPDARILVLGAGDSRFDAGSDGGSDSQVVYSDVALAPDTHLIADAHDIPFVGGTFDAVFAIAVLEHVVDPNRCVAEIRRVLRPGGYVYAVTPFLQQVHMGAYDFTRFTPLGHRRLFCWFDEVRTGIANGPGMSVAWAIEYFMASMARTRRARSLLKIIARLLSWPFLLADGWLARKPGSWDAASAVYFYGRLRTDPLPDESIIAGYRGLNGKV